MESIILGFLTFLNIGSGQSRINFLFWDELEELLGPIWEPIVGPLFDVLREESFRLIMLSTIITVCIFVVVVTYIVYEVPSVISWFVGGMSLASEGSASPPKRSTRTRESQRRPSTPTLTEAPLPSEVPAPVRGIDVRSLIEREQDVTILHVDIENQSDHRIEMVVADIDVPEGVEILTGSFRMQRIGTIESGDSRRCTFRLKQLHGSLSEIKGHVEFMSSSYEITEVLIPSPVIED